MNIEKYINLCAISGITSAFMPIFGGYDAALAMLICMMGADMLTGIIDAAVFHTSDKSNGGALTSKAFLKGFCRKIYELVIVVVAVQLGRHLGMPFMRGFVINVLAANEALSCMENMVKAGIPFPKAIRDAIDILQNEEDVDDGNHGEVHNQ